MALTVCGGFGFAAAEPLAVSAGPSWGGDFQEGDRVGELEIVLPSKSEFVLRGTLPIPPFVYRLGDPQPVRIVDYDGSLVENTQVEIVSRYPDGSADVIEVIGRVRADPALSSGDRVRYGIERSSGLAAPDYGVAGIEDLTGATSVPISITDLVGQTKRIAVVATDALDNLYVHYPFNPLNDIQVERYGAGMSSLRTYGVMEHWTGSKNPYKHFLGVHTYAHVSAGDETLMLDFRFSNSGMDVDESTLQSADDLLGKVYFKKIELWILQGYDEISLPSYKGLWLAQQLFSDPSAYLPNLLQFQQGEKPGVLPFGSADVAYLRYPIVKPPAPTSGNEAVHMIPCRGQFTRRWVISRKEEAAFGREAIYQGGLGYCVPGLNEEKDLEYWSWWNNRTARYYPQRVRLAQMNYSNNDYVGLDVNPDLSFKNSVRGTLDKWFYGLRNQMAHGAPTPYPDEDSAPVALGWARPMGVPYGGETGGKGIRFVDGWRTLAGAHTTGYLYLMLQHRMTMDRMPVANFKLNGDSIAMKDLLVAAPDCEFCPKAPAELGGQPSYAVTDLSFCPPDDSTAQNRQVKAGGLQPFYDTYPNSQFNLNGWDPHDDQHLIRYLGHPMALSWIGNDSLAKDSIRFQAEQCRLLYSEYPESPVQDISSANSLRADECFVEQHPHSALKFGRREGWLLQSCNAAFALSDDEYRGRTLPWFNRILEMLSDAQLEYQDPTFTNPANGKAYPCSIIYAQLSSKFYGDDAPAPRARQVWEELIIANSLYGMRRSVFSPGDPQQGRLLKLLRGTLFGAVSPIAWDEEGSVPYGLVPVSEWHNESDCNGHEPLSIDAICCEAEIPADFQPNLGTTASYIWTGLAAGYLMTNDAFFLNRGVEMLGGEAGAGFSFAEAQAMIVESLQSQDPMKPTSRDEWCNKVVLLGLLQ